MKVLIELDDDVFKDIRESNFDSARAIVRNFQATLTDAIRNGVTERKVGKWLVKDNGNGGKYVECPFCGALAPSTEFADRTVWKYSKFCYDCGNELRGSKNE